jgi:hypothetical protein
MIDYAPCSSSDDILLGEEVARHITFDASERLLSFGPGLFVSLLQLLQVYLHGLLEDVPLWLRLALLCGLLAALLGLFLLGFIGFEYESLLAKLFHAFDEVLSLFYLEVLKHASLDALLLLVRHHVLLFDLRE